MMESPTSPRTEASSLDEANSRKRRRVQDSSTAGSELSITSSSSGGAYTAERYRVGIPALQLLPLLALLSICPLASARVAEFLPRIHGLLERRYIEFEEHDIDLCCRTIPGDTPSNDDLTLLVIAKWNSDNDGQNWYLAADDIRKLFVSAELGEWVGVTWGDSLKANANRQSLGYVMDAVDVISWIESRGDGKTYRARLPTA